MRMSKRIIKIWLGFLGSSLLSNPAMAVEVNSHDPHVNLVWLAICSALVFFMQAGFALLEGGSCRAKNTVNVIMKNFTDMCFGALGFWIIGYGLMFGANASGWIGTSHFMVQQGSSSEMINILYQMMFAATAATIISGAVAERMRFWPYLLSSMIVTTIIYPIFGSWVWNSDGWLNKLGFIDFAGSTVVHSVGGWCALVGVVILGPRLGRYARNGKMHDIPGHNLPMVALGGLILWMGWFGFNGGSVAGDMDKLGIVLLNTQLSGAAGVVGAILYMGIRKQPILMTVTVNSAIGGLVGITAGALTMSPGFALVTGLISGIITVAGAQWLERKKVDDVVGAISAHAFCGSWGTLAAGMFYAGDLFSVSRILVQIIGILVAFFWCIIMASAMFILLNKVFKLRASSLHEQRGLDYTEHYEIGYSEFQNSITHQDKE